MIPFGIATDLTIESPSRMHSGGGNTSALVFAVLAAAGSEDGRWEVAAPGEAARWRLRVGEVAQELDELLLGEERFVGGVQRFLLLGQGGSECSSGS